VPYKNKADRKYENANKYQAQPEQVKNRVARNAARRKLMREGKVSKGDGKDVAHVKAFDKGGSNKNGVRVESASKNRSFKRDSKRNLVSETSTRERKKK
jgi:putative SOS response-associated peptidase YedK